MSVRKTIQIIYMRDVLWSGITRARDGRGDDRAAPELISRTELRAAVRALKAKDGRITPAEKRALAAAWREFAKNGSRATPEARAEYARLKAALKLP